MKKRDNFIVFLAFVFLTLIIFRNYFLKGQIPFPANLLVSYYSPWRYYQWEGYPNGPPTKPIGFDVLRFVYPYRKFTVDQIKAGQWPLWNPYNFSGNIHLATYQASVFYPFNFFYFILPLIDAWSLLVILQPILSGLFMYLFLKEINLSWKASFFGALAFAFSGWMLAWLEESLVIEHSALWLPLILYAVEKVIKKSSPGRIVLLVLAITASILAGFLQLTIYVLAASLAWLIFRRQKLVVLGLAFLFSFLISAVHLLPAVEAYFHSVRKLVDVKFLFDQYLMKPWHLITFLAPDFWGNPGVYNHFASGFYHEKVIYLGIPVLLFSLFGLLLKQKDKTLCFFKWFSLTTLALGFFPLGWLLYYSRLPLFSTMMPSRIFFLSTFGFCVLAAFGLDFYFKKKPDGPKWKNIFLPVGGLFLLLWLFVLYQKIIFPQGNYATVSFRNLILPTAFFLASAVVILFRRLSFLGLVVLLSFSSIYFANKFLYFSEKRFVFPEVEVITQLKKLAGINRVWGYGNGYLERNTNMFYGLSLPGGYEALFPQRYGELLYAQKTKGRITSQISRSDADIEYASERDGVLDNWYRQRLLSLLGVKYIIETKLGEGKQWSLEQKRFPQSFFHLVWEDDQFKIWEYLEALPRVFLVNDYVVEEDKQKIADYLFDENFDLEKKIVLEAEPDLKIEKRETKGAVKLIDYSPNQIELETESSSSALLFLSDNDYPGWQASINGRKAKILRANYSFRALAVPQGKQKIVFSYKPKIFFWSLRTSLFSLVLFISWLTFVKIRAREK